jgi:hypothetical protein
LYAAQAAVAAHRAAKAAMAAKVVSVAVHRSASTYRLLQMLLQPSKMWWLMVLELPEQVVLVRMVAQAVLVASAAKVALQCSIPT